MSLPVPLTVRIKTARADRHITRDLRDLTFRSVAPGGFASATMSLDRPLRWQPDDIAYYANVYIYDARSAQVMWEGRLEDPGRSAGADGQIWELAAIGGMAHASDRTVPLHYVDTSLERWESDGDPDAGRIRSSNDSSSGDILALRYTIARGTVVPTGTYKVFRYRTVDDAGLKLARVAGEVKSGTAYASLATEIITRTGIAGAADVAVSQAWDTSATAVNATTAGSITNGRTVVEIRLNRTTSSLTVADDASTSVFRGVAIQAMRYTAAGVEITTGYTADTLAAHTVVNDLLGRLLTEYAGSTAEVESTAYSIDQLVYPDGATPAQVLEDLMTLEPAYYWAVWASHPDTGRYLFEWRSWPTTVRYEADVSDGYQSTASGDGLYNRCTVRYRDRNGRIRKYTHTGQAVQELDDAGLIREAFIDLGDEVGSLANATQVAALFLQENRFPRNAGQLTIARPIFDRDKGRYVMPWEIRPGHLIRVRGVKPNIDSLNATERDGVTVFKIVSTEFNAGSATAQLELDSYPFTVARALAKLEKQRARKR